MPNARKPQAHIYYNSRLKVNEIDDKLVKIDQRPAILGGEDTLVDDMGNPIMIDPVSSGANIVDHAATTITTASVAPSCVMQF